MDQKNCRSLWPKITLTLVVLAALYVISFGPACWISSRVQAKENAVETVYQPLLRLVLSGPDWLRRAVIWYSAFGVAPQCGSMVFRAQHGSHCHWTYAVP